MLEVGDAQAETVAGLMEATRGFEGVRIARDAANHPRVVRGRRRLVAGASD
jgi:methylase of polypeptide subunit release factors